MNFSGLLELVEHGESEKIEFKRTTGQRSDGAKAVCAMLNGLGGFVLFGVNDDGHINGQQVTSKTLEDIAAELGRIEPPAFPDIETVNLENGNSVVVLRVSGGGGPYTYDGRPYVRNGATTHRMPQQYYERLLLERMHASNRWENQEARGVSINDLNAVEIVRTVEEAVRRQRLEDPGTRDPVELLRGLGLLNDSSILNAAVVLFIKSENVLPNYPQCQLKMARFRGLDKTEFIDNRQEYGNAFDLLQRTQRFFRDHLPVAGRIVPGIFERIDDPLYPPAALREAVANALCHRDYSLSGGSVSIAIFDDRLEISSSGILPFDLTTDDLTKPHASRPWNPLIAQAFYRRGIIETWGRGTIKIQELTSSAGLAPPEFSCQMGEVVVKFYSAQLESRLESQLGSRLESDDASLQERVVALLKSGPMSKSEISTRLGQKQVSGQLHHVIRL
ncbi:MAG: ATP-binding protein, partial [Armatimonadota bacterium]